jgi:HEAT repeat protein
MSSFLQLDLFNDRPDFERPSNALSAEPVVPERLTDDELISAIPDATLADARALATEAGARRLSAAVLALTSLCNRFVGWGADVTVPEQVAALNALGVIGGPEASHAVSQLIAKRIVQGPTLVTATTVASQLGVIFPSGVAVALLRHSNPLVRAAACACVRSGYEIITALLALINDPDDEVATASACALGRMGRIEALRHLKRYLLERPSRRIVESLAGVADEEAIVFLARTGKARRELTDIVISALEEIESPRAFDAAAALKRFSSQAE